MSAKKVKNIIPINNGVKFLFVVFAVMVVFSGKISSNQALSLAEDQVNSIVSSQGLIATSTDISFDNGIYKVLIDISQGEMSDTAEVYLTRDGKLMIVGNVYETDGLQKGPSRTEFDLDGSELSIGNPNAPVTVIEFSDLQCPFCKKFYDLTLKDLKTNYIDTGKVYFVYKHFPLSFHPSAQIAGEATECANEQGVWYEYHENVFYENDEFLNACRDPLTPAKNCNFGVNELKQWAIGIVSDTSAFNECLDSGKYTDKVDADFNEGKSVGVSGTPASFVNGILVSGAQPYESFKVLIDSELRD